MDSIDKRRQYKDRTKVEIMKRKLIGYQKDMEVREAILGELERIDGKMESLGAVVTDRTPVQGGGSSQEDKLVRYADQKKDLERELKLIDLENRKLLDGVSSLDELGQAIVWEVWTFRRKSMHDISREYFMGISTAYRKSDEVLCSLYDQMYERLWEK